MSDKKWPCDVSIAKVTDLETLERYYKACADLAEKTKEEMLPLRSQWVELDERVRHLEWILGSAESKAQVIRAKLDATKALSTIEMRHWYQINTGVPNALGFFCPTHKNASNRLTGIHIGKVPYDCNSTTVSWFKLYQKGTTPSRVGKRFSGDFYFQVNMTTLNGADLEKLSRLTMMIVLGRHLEKDLEEMLVHRDKSIYRTYFGICDGQIVKLELNHS